VKLPTFRTEADLCAAFISAVPKTWVAYPETAGWDILLVRGKDGYQIGVQAKLKLNAKVLAQAVEGYYPVETGPDYRAVLVPSGEWNDLTALAPYCGITVIGMLPPDSYVSHYSNWFSPSLPADDRYLYSSSEWHDRLPIKRHLLPEYVPDVVAGSSSPLQLTKWKIAAIKLMILLDHSGYLTRQDFKRVQIDIRRWIDGSGWLQASPQGFIAGPRCPDLKLQHPRVWDEIVVDPKKWARDQGLFAEVMS